MEDVHREESNPSEVMIVSEEANGSTPMDTDSQSPIGHSNAAIMDEVNSTEGDNLETINSNVEERNDGEEEKPIGSLNNEAVAVTEQQEKKTGWKKVSEFTTERQHKQQKKPSVKRLPVATGVSSSSKESPLLSSTDMNPTVAIKGTRKKKMVKGYGDMMLSSESQTYPYPPHPSSPPRLSAAQAAVDEMFRQALQEQQYSAAGSIVESDDESIDESNSLNRERNDFTTRAWCVGVVASKNNAPSLMTVDRNLILASMRQRLRIEGATSQQSSIYHTDANKKLDLWEEDEEEVEEEDDLDEEEEEDYDNDSDGEELQENLDKTKESIEDNTDKDGGKQDGRWNRKRKRGRKPQGEIDTSNDIKDELSDSEELLRGNDPSSRAKGVQVPSDASKKNVQLPAPTYREDYYDDDDDDANRKEMEESSIFGQTFGSTNATWVECDKCGKWRRLRGVVDANKLPTKWFCSMNKRDPDRAKCSAPEEKYDTTSTSPESAADQRARKHLRLWVRRLNCNENYEARMLTTMTRGKKKINSTSCKDPYEWVRCCNPSCGKWRALLKFMDSSNILEAARNGEWFCVMNTWDEKVASCSAPQEHLPSTLPPWVHHDEMM